MEFDLDAVNNLEFGLLPPASWELFKNLRLEALQDSPHAFSASYEEEVTFPDEKWQDRLEQAEKEHTNFLYFAHYKGKPVGMIGAYIEPKIKTKHIAHIWGAYVTKNYRNLKVGTRLTQLLFDKLSAREDIIKLQIESVSTQLLAVNIYKSYGFDMVGILKRELRVGDTFYDIYLMEKIVR